MTIADVIVVGAMSTFLVGFGLWCLGQFIAELAEAGEP